MKYLLYGQHLVADNMVEMSQTFCGTTCYNYNRNNIYKNQQNNGNIWSNIIYIHKCKRIGTLNVQLEKYCQDEHEYDPLDLNKSYHLPTASNAKVSH